MVIQQFKLQSKNYPELLRQIDTPPKSLYVLGKLPDAPMLTIVGSRKPSSYGRDITYNLAYDCAKAGIVVVSGLALGLDAVAHQAAIDAGGLTVAVLACGLDEVYPSSHRKLAIDILTSGGALISEYSVGTPPQKHHFVARNRIEAGLSLGVVVTEAMASSGTLITANFGLGYDRTVMAVPGNVTSLLSAGPNNLIRNGAIPVTSSTDILEYLGIATTSQTTIQASSPVEQLIIDLLNQGVNQTEQILAGTNITAADLATTLSLMEITGKIKNHGAGVWSLR